jgi:hypothetical protein
MSCIGKILIGSNIINNYFIFKIMKKLIILTVAIPRGKMHLSSIGNFYKMFDNCAKV